MSNPGRYCTFLLDGLRLAIEVGRVQEVMKPNLVTRVPSAPPDVRGLINLRGRVVAAIDLRHRLGMKPFGEHDDPISVVVNTGDGVVSLFVDEIGDVVELDERVLRQAPETISTRLRDVIVGIDSSTTDLLVVLDADRVAGVLPTVLAGLTEGESLSAGLAGIPRTAPLAASLR